MGRHPLFWVDSETLLDEAPGGVGDVAPVFDGCEGVVGLQDGLHLFEVRVSVERGVSAEEEVCDDPDSPDVAATKSAWMRATGEISLHRLAVAGLLEDLGSHIARCTAGGGQDVELLLVHDPR